MKKVLIGFMFFILISGVLAADYPIKIQASKGDVVTLNIRDLDTDSSVYNDGGLVGDTGVFETKLFYPLNRPNLVYRVKVSAELEVLQDVKFDDLDTHTPILIDCSGVCSVSTHSNESVEEIVNDTMAVVEEIVNDTETVEEMVVGESGAEDKYEGSSSGILGFVTSEIGGERRPIYVGGLGAFMGIVLFFFIVKRAYKSGAKAELKNLGKMQLDEKIDALDD